jgi:ABC-2 type transport system permease protein
MIAFGFALDTDVKHMPMVVLDESRTEISRRWIAQFENTQTFRVAGEVGSVAEMAAEMRKGRAYVGLQIPPEFARDVESGRTARAQVLIDGSSSTIALSALNTSLAVALRESMLILLRQTGRSEVPVEIRPQILYNPDMKSPNFFIPGVIGVVLQIATTFATALSVVKERERGTLEQLLVSPLSPWGLMLGKITPFFVIGMIMGGALFTIMRYVFHVPIHGSVPWLMASTAVYNFCLLSLGLLISTRADNAMQALQLSMTLILPSVFFSGFIFPRDTMPWIFYQMGSLLPTTYFIAIERALILRGAHFSEYLPDLLSLTAMAVVLFALCAIRFRRKIA